MPIGPKRRPHYRSGTSSKHGKDPSMRRLSSHQRGYTGKWRTYRKAFLSKPANVLCVHCLLLEPPRHTPANEVDHIIPHKGDSKLFWDRANHQALCKPCHSRKTATEDGGFGAFTKR